MIIVFGKRSYRLAKKTFNELQLPEPAEQMTVEARQYFFHVCYIPIFPVGRKWVVRRSDNLLYEPTPQLLARLEQEEVPKAKSVWAFSGLLALGLFLLFVLGNSLFQDISYQREQAKMRVENIVSIEEHINSPTQSDYYLFSFNETTPGLWINQTYFKVVDYTESEILLMCADKDPLKDLGYEYRLDPTPLFIPGTKSYGRGEIYTVTKADLLKAVNYDYDDAYDFNGTVLPTIDSRALFYLETIEQY